VPASNTPPSVFTGVFNAPFAEQVAFFRGKLGNLVPTARWDDISKSAHDRGFMVAGAVKADLLADLAAAVDRAISEGKSIDVFRKDFRAIVKKHGWHDWTGEGSAKGVAWRTRIIYNTNAITSYSAGRLAQLREGNFAFMVYRHNDTVTYPRPLHQAWNGLVLASDAPWWKTHYPPNGWGCRCYVVGARSKDAARRLGGDPDKKPDAAWNKKDAKTGAPVGIDKGWDYAPGDSSVSDTVQQMAKKTQQWEYTLAKAFMQGVPASVRDDLARAYRDLPSVADDLRRYAQAALAGRDTAPYRTIGLLTAADVAFVSTLNDAVATAGFDYAIDSYAVRHVFDKHGTETTEVSRGQRAVTSADYAKLPVLLNGYDEVVYAGHSDVGHPIFRFSKQIGDETFIAAFEVRKKRRMMALQSFWIRRGF